MTSGRSDQSAAMEAGDAADASPLTSRNRDIERQAADLVAQMTLQEKLTLVRSDFFLNPAGPPTNANSISFHPDALGTAGFVPGIERLGIPAQQQSDASLGISLGPTPFPERRNVTALPASIALAASWNCDLARAGGEVVGREARSLGINIMLAGGVNLTRDPRCGRNFEYLGEDPLLAGVMAGQSIAAVQSAGVVSTTKHFALNAQETGRHLVDETIDEAALRESDLLAFQVAIEIGQPGAVMTAYNKVNSAYCSEHSWLISEVLKRDWAFPGWVMSDWGAVHSTREAALAGLDQQSGRQLDPEPYFGALLQAEASRDPEIAARIDDMVRRILYSMISVGLLDQTGEQAVDADAHLMVAQRQAEEGVVLLANHSELLPLARNVRSIAIIGAHADIGVLSGGGSSTVTPAGSHLEMRQSAPIPGMATVYHPTSPLAAFRAAAPNARVMFSPGSDRVEAAALARESEVAIVFAQRWDCEAGDAPDLSLPDNQDELIAEIAAANPRTIVVLTTGGPVLTPWLDNIGALLAAWYPGHRGAEAIARIVFGEVNPSGRLPVTFPASTDQLPRPAIPGFDSPQSRQGLFRFGEPFSSNHIEGADVGYRWFERTDATPLFPFGFGLSYTTFALSDLEIEATGALRAKVTNTGARVGKQVMQIYARPPHEGAVKRLVAFGKVELQPGETKQVELQIEPRLLTRFDVKQNVWRRAAGEYQFYAGFASNETQLTATVSLSEQSMPA
ncbi:MAG: glycoside hydrolase family 3 C-terminal domain-containing protein [Hyphomonadaceae bacterium]|nr:glycoside hydrolase family 3 C-terminal domain-containing protein [Hyphomonadaceae bacterium]